METNGLDTNRKGLKSPQFTESLITVNMSCYVLLLDVA